MCELQKKLYTSILLLIEKLSHTQCSLECLLRVFRVAQIQPRVNRLHKSIKGSLLFVLFCLFYLYRKTNKTLKLYTFL